MTTTIYLAISAIAFLVPAIVWPKDNFNLMIKVVWSLLFAWSLYEFTVLIGKLPSPETNLLKHCILSNTIWTGLLGIFWNSSDYLNITIKVLLIIFSITGVLIIL